MPNYINTQPWRFIRRKDAESKQNQRLFPIISAMLDKRLRLLLSRDIKAFGEFPGTDRESHRSRQPSQQRHGRFCPIVKKGWNERRYCGIRLIAATGNTDIAIEHMVLQALDWEREHVVGYDSFDDNKVKEILEIPKNIEMHSIASH